MVVINELLPNPFHRDNEGEFIEILNRGSEAANLTGLRLEDRGGKKFFLKGELRAGDFLVFPYKTTKISLNNSDEAVSLFGVGGELLDRAEFSGAVREGMSLARRGESFIFTDTPTPGKENIFSLEEQKVEDATQASGAMTIKSSIGWLEAVVWGMALSAFVSFLVVRLLRRSGFFDE